MSNFIFYIKSEQNIHDICISNKPCRRKNFVCIANMQLDSYSGVLTAKFSALHRAQTKFRKACIQLTLLNKQLEDVKMRYQQAKEDNFRCFRYNLRLKLAVIEGMRNMYYDYAYMKAEDVVQLRYDLFGETVEIVDSETDEE